MPLDRTQRVKSVARAPGRQQHVADLAAPRHVAECVERQDRLVAEEAADRHRRQAGAHDQGREELGGRRGDGEARRAAMGGQEGVQLGVRAQRRVVARQQRAAAVVEAEPARQAGRGQHQVARREDRAQRPGQRQDQQGEAADRSGRPLAAPDGGGARGERDDRESRARSTSSRARRRRRRSATRRRGRGRRPASSARGATASPHRCRPAPRPAAPAPTGSRCGRCRRRR